MKKILFVCTGNICRSPTAEAIAKHIAKENNKEKLFYFDSAGTDSYHAGQAPDSRSIAIGAKKGISFSGIVARQITSRDLIEFDLILCMDRGHLKRLMSRFDLAFHHKIKLFLEFCEIENRWNDEVIDPYYGGNEGFEAVFETIKNGIENLLKSENE